MDVFELTRALVDIESITGGEERAGLFLHDYLSTLAAGAGGRVERMDVAPGRFNVFAQWGERPVVTFSSHMDTVPPFFPSRDDGEFLWGRGACDAKGIMASMIKAVEALLDAGESGFGLLFVVGEERNSAGAYHAATTPRGSRYLVNGAHGKQAGAGRQGGAALRSCGHGQDGALGLPRVGGFGHSQAD